MTDVDAAVAAVKKWLAERDRAERFDRRYARDPKSVRRASARMRRDAALAVAIVALMRLPGGTVVEVDGVRYRGVWSTTGWEIHVEPAIVDELPAGAAKGSD
jgi:hypothetical protein